MQLGRCDWQVLCLYGTICDMVTDEPGSATLRNRQQEAVRLAIVEAYLAVAHRGGALTVSVAAVAQEAGVSRRTVYRYFPAKDDLQEAAAFHMSERALFGGTMADTTVENLVDQLKMLWSGLSDNIAAVFAERASPSGRQLRVTRLEQARETAAAAFPAGAEPESVDLVVAVTSSSMFLELVERMDYAPEVAAHMAARLARLVVDDERGAPQ